MRCGTRGTSAYSSGATTTLVGTRFPGFSLIWDDPSMGARLRTYTAYSIGCAIVWIVLIAIGIARGKSSPEHSVLFVILGWALGWTSATIARYVYPPPKKYRLRAE